MSPGGVWRELLGMERALLAQRLLLVALLFHPVGNRWLRPLAMLLAAIGLLSTRALQGVWLWVALLGIATLRVTWVWPLSDNHAYLLAYWCLAATIGALAQDRDRVLAWNGRALVAGTFVFALLWKIVLSPDFLDGRFFAVSLVDDPRFESLAILSGIDEDRLLDLRARVREHVDGVSIPWDDAPEPPARLWAVARSMTFATVAIEAAVALSFLAPLGWLGRLRHALLALFCAATYALAPVAGFGWLLLSMGIAQCEPERVRSRVGYLVAFALVLLATRWPVLETLVREAR